MIEEGKKVRIKDIHYDENIEPRYSWGRMRSKKGEKGIVKKYMSDTSAYIDFPSHHGLWHAHPSELTVVNKHHQVIEENYNI